MGKLPRSGNRSGGLLSLPLCVWSMCVIGAFGAPQVPSVDFSREINSSDALVGGTDVSKQELRYACPARCRCGIMGTFANKKETIDCSQLSGLTALPPMPTSGASAVETLKIDVNSLAELPDRGLQSLSSLTWLSASFNKVTLRLRKYSFYGLSELQRLQIFKSNIEYLPAGVFNGLSKLTKLYLKFNKLTSMPRGVFSPLKMLNYVDLRGNQYMDCKTIDELKEMSVVTALVHDSCVFYPDMARPCNLLGTGLPSAYNLCPSQTSNPATCGADASSNCCWVEVSGGNGLCIVSPSRKGLE